MAGTRLVYFISSHTIPNCGDFEFSSWYRHHCYCLSLHGMVEKQSIHSLGFFGRAPLIQGAWALSLCASLLALFVALPVLLGQSLKDLVPVRDSLWFAIPYRLIFVGFAEELLFRGYLLNSIKRISNSTITAIVVSSFLFGAWHYILSGSIAQVAFTTAIGIILAVPRMAGKNCSIVSVSLAHGLYDATLSILSWVI
jgi:membrane protease YdiL (CAAX protease family)